jgi:DNA repair protein RadD
MQLREHQTKAIDMIRQSFRAGNKRVLLAACCSFGKTHTAAYMLKSAQDSGKRAVFFCDRIKLIDQTIEALDQWGISYGVQQADHWLANPAAPIQICSMQTIARRGYDKLDFDLCIVDECHSISKKIVEMIRTWDGEKMYYVGLSATPYAKGMGLLWQDMVVPVSQQELLKQGYLAPVRYYGGRSIDVRGLRSKALKTGSSDYHPDDVARVTEEEQEGLTGDIIKNWLAHGENAQTIAFCPSIKHSKYLVKCSMRLASRQSILMGTLRKRTARNCTLGMRLGHLKSCPVQNSWV